MQWVHTKLNAHPFWLTFLALLLIADAALEHEELITTTHRVTTHQVLEELDDIPLQLGRAHSTP
jgi:hypothetical protein